MIVALYILKLSRILYIFNILILISIFILRFSVIYTSIKIFTIISPLASTLLINKLRFRNFKIIKTLLLNPYTRI